MSRLRRSDDLQNARADLGPPIQRIPIESNDGKVIREPRIDVVRAEHMGESARGIAWLPLRMHVRRHLTMCQVAAISRYADLVDIAEGVRDTAGPASANAPWLRCAITDTMVAARMTLDGIQRSLDRRSFLAINALIRADNQGEVARRLGCDAKRVPAVAAAAADELDDWFSGKRAAA